MLSRRAFVVGGIGAFAVAAGGLALVEDRVVPGRARLNQALGLEGGDGAIPAVAPGPRVNGSFDSNYRHTKTSWSISYPPGSGTEASLPVLISLHGKGSDHESSFSAIGLDRFLADAVAKGSKPFAIVSVDGGDTYWHARADGTDSGSMVLHELIPMLGARGLDTARLGFYGWSMGGYGALLLSSASGHPHVRVIATSSAALWTEPGSTAPGAFDDAADYAAHDVFRLRANLQGMPVRMDCGTDDPFHDANAAYRSGLPERPAGGFEPGLHTDGYWRRMAPAELVFVAAHLTPATDARRVDQAAQAVAAPAPSRAMRKPTLPVELTGVVALRASTR